MEPYQRTGNLSQAALRADMGSKTARKYLRAGKLPSEMSKDHDWRTRPDPFAEHWNLYEAMLEDALRTGSKKSV